MFLTPVSHRQPPTLSRCTPAPSVPYHLPPRMSYHTCPRSHCDLTCSHINYPTRGGFTAAHQYREPALLERNSWHRGISPFRHRSRKSADVSTFSSGSRVFFHLTKRNRKRKRRAWSRIVLRKCDSFLPCILADPVTNALL